MKKKVEDKLDYNHFKEYLKSRVIYNGIADSITVTEPQDEEKDILFIIDCKDYKIEITCEDIACIDIDYRFIYPECDTKFRIEDIFNVLNIDNFDDNTFIADRDDEKNQDKAINDLLCVIKKYDYDIRKAGSDAYLTDMENMHNADEMIYDSDDLKFTAMLRYNRLVTKMQSKKDDKSIHAVLKEMQKLESRNLLTFSQRRYKNYIEQGYPIPDNTEDELNEAYSYYAKKSFLAYAICYICGIIISFLIFFADRAIISREGIFVNDDISYIIALVAGVLFGYILNRFFGTKIITALSKEEQRDNVKKERLERYDSEGTFRKICSKYIVFAFSLIAAPIFMIVASSGVCFTDNAIINHYIINTQVQYDEAEISLVKGTYDDGEYFEYEAPYYRIIYDDGLQMDTGQIFNEEKSQTIEQLLKENNVEIKEVNE